MKNTKRIPRRRRRARPVGAGAVLLLLLCLPATLIAQARTFDRGDTVRVRRAVDLDVGQLTTHGWRKGILLDIKSDTLLLESLGKRQPNQLLLDTNSRVDVLRGKKPFGVIKGVLIGSALATIGGLIYEGTDSFEEAGCEVVDRSINGSPIYGNCDRALRNFSGVIIPLGGIFGGLGGYLLRTDRWQPASRVP